MKKFIAPILLMTTLTSFAGNEKGNGGDIFTCKPAPQMNSFAGDYVLDYITSVTSASERNIVSFNTTAEYVAYVQGFLKKMLPDLVITFNHFAKSLPENAYGETIPSSQYIWQRGTDLVDVRDENLIERFIPANCRFKTQAVIKFGNVYYYDEASFVTMPTENPKQFSFLLVHEWLRTYLTDSRVIRIVNAFIHNKSSIDLTPGEVQKILANVTGGKLGSYASNKEKTRSILENAISAGNVEDVKDYLELNSTLVKEFAKGFLDRVQENDVTMLNVLLKYASEEQKQEALVAYLNSDKPNLAKHLLAKGVSYQSSVDLVLKYENTDTELFVGLMKSSDWSLDTFSKLVDTCIENDSVLCLELVAVAGLPIEKARIHFGSKMRSDYFEIGSRRFRPIMNALVASALKGKVQVYKYLLENFNFSKLSEVRVITEHFRVVTNCTGCVSTSNSLMKDLGWILNKRIKSLEIYQKDICKEANYRESCLMAKEELENIRMILDL